MMNAGGQAAQEPRHFGTLLKRYRVVAGLTQEALAERAHISARGISDLERGVRRVPRPDTLALLASALQLSTEANAAFEMAARGLGDPAPERRDGTHFPITGPVPPSLVGRTCELGLLEGHLAGSGPPVLLLAGEPGIGKSRLLREATRRAAGAGLRVLQGGCHRRGGQEPYSPLLEALEQHIRQQAPARLRQDLKGCSWLVRLLPELAEGPIEPLPAWTLAPEQERRLLFKAVARFVANVAGPGGTLLVLDDLQWAGADALDLLAMLARSVPEIPVRVVGAYRTTEVQPHDPLAMLLTDLARADLLSHQSLTALAPAEAARLLDALLENSNEAGSVRREQILQRAGGVPFFLISYARGLHSGVQPTRVPWDLTQSIRQRVAVLPETARAVLGLAAVIGRQVGDALLVSTATSPEEEVLAALELACQAQLLEDAGREGYRFAHDVIREVLEAELGTAQRAVLHRRIAEVLERSAGERPLELLAYHFARGGVPDKAVLYLEQAGDHARDQYANAAAAGYYHDLVELLESAGRVVDAATAREKWGAVQVTMARYDAALAVLERAADTYRAAGDLESLGRVTAQIGHAYGRKGTPAEGVTRLQTLQLQLEPRGPSHGLALLYTTLAELLCLSGRFDQALEAAEWAVTIAHVVRDEQILGRAEYERGSVLGVLGRQEESRQALEAAIAHAEATDELASLSQALDMMGCMYEERGAFAQSRAFTERALAVAERQGDPVTIAFLISRRGMSAFFTGDWTGAREDYERAVALGREIGTCRAYPYLLLNLGRLSWAEGAWEEAAQLLEESCDVSARSGNLDALRWAQAVLAERDVVTGQAEAARTRLVPLLSRPGLEASNVVSVCWTLAWANLELGELGQADALIEQGIGRARAANYRRALPEALRVQALVRVRQGRWAEAEGALEEGLALARSMPYPHIEGRLLHDHGVLHVNQGQTEWARERLEAALAIFLRLGARKDLERTERLLATLG